MSVRPIRLAAQPVLDAVRARAQLALDAWARDWLHDGVCAPLQVSPACEADRLRSCEHQIVQGQSGALWVRHALDDMFDLGRAVAGMSLASALDGDWIAAVVGRAWHARNRALCTALLGAPTDDAPASDAPPEHLFAFGAGALQVSSALLGLHAIVDAAAWTSLPPQRAAPPALPKKVLLEQAARSCLLPLEVMLGSVEVELPQLLDLRRGDVLRLPQRLDRELQLLCAGKPLGRVVLGTSHGRKAVQLVAIPQTSSPKS